MLTTSELYQQLLQTPGTRKEVRAVIGGETYGEDRIVSLSTSANLFAEDTMSIGGAVAKEIELAVRAPGTIPRMAKIVPSYRLVNGAQTSEWIQKGVYYIDTRSADEATGVLTIHGYDDMLKAEQTWQPDQSLTFPMTMAAAVLEIAELMGVTIDPRTSLSTAYLVDYPANEYTLRDVLRYIAAAHAGNWIMTDAGQLRLVTFGEIAAPAATAALGYQMAQLSKSPALEQVSKIVLLVDDDTAYVSGTDTGRTVEVTCPYGTQAMADSILAALQAYTYTPVQAQDALLDPAAELGDGLSAGGVTTVLAQMDTLWDALMASDAGAPGKAEQESEYSYQSPLVGQLRYQLAQTRSEISKTAEEINLKIEATDGRVSEVEQTVDGITLTVTSSTSPDGQTTASIVLKVGPNSYTGYIKLDGNVDVSGQLSAEALYAALGDIADLTVDRLSTSRRIVKYLAGDQSDDNYIRIQEQYLEFVSGVYAGGTEQATNPNGGLIYWEADPSGATIGSDGYPYVDGERIFTTTNVTDWPVMIYTYKELAKRSIAFEQQGDQYVPVDVFGAGDAQGRQQGRLVKDTEGLLLGYQSQSGKDIGLHMGDDGYMDLYGLRKTTGLNFGEWDSGRFYERIDGDDTRYQYDVAFDAQGRPVKITDSDGHETIIDW